MSGSATFATERLRFATAATRISEMRTTPARSGAADVSGALSSAIRDRITCCRRVPILAEILALVAALLFAVAATLQQKGALTLGLSPDSLRSFAKLAASKWWLVGSIALLVGYVVQAIALDHGRLAIIQPLLVTTVVFALPLGYFLTAQEVGLRQIVGAAVVVLGLAMYAIFGDPAGGNENAPNDEWAIALGILGVVCVLRLRGSSQERFCAPGRVLWRRLRGSCSASPPVLSSRRWRRSTTAACRRRCRTGSSTDGDHRHRGVRCSSRSR